VDGDLQATDGLLGKALLSSATLVPATSGDPVTWRKSRVTVRSPRATIVVTCP